jgi:hypothetical protein
VPGGYDNFPGKGTIPLQPLLTDAGQVP